MKFVLILLSLSLAVMLLFFYKKVISAALSKNYLFNWNRSQIIFDNQQKFPVHFSCQVDCDIKTFEVIKDHWAKDKNFIIYEGKARPEIDIHSFHLDKNDLPKDNKFVYTTSWEGNTKKLLVWEGANPVTFETLPLRDGYKPDLWGKDDKNYFYMLHVITCDYNSFEIFDATYARDKDSVYYGSVIIDGADSKTFHYDRETRTYRDKNNMYSQGKKVNN